ncbi:unnamed protein product [Caenorhabditis auriculariae]|uniref:Uncharacterized protein n=1 Tax=Caenorhabditis auriculariae TaxID=2777116 RepID=A0A8S1HZX6_9PELO|nr:unnamed protein product [Caenorhabditis auriculariae]
MSLDNQGSSKDEKNMNVFLQITNDNRALIEEIRDRVIASELALDDPPPHKSKSSSKGTKASPLSVQELLRSSMSNSNGPSTSQMNQFPAPNIAGLNPFQLALCQSLAAFPNAFAASPILPMFVPQVTIPAPNLFDANEALKILQNYWAAQQANSGQQ